MIKHSLFRICCVQGSVLACLGGLTTEKGPKAHYPEAAAQSRQGFEGRDGQLQEAAFSCRGVAFPIDWLEPFVVVMIEAIASAKRIPAVQPNSVESWILLFTQPIGTIPFPPGFMVADGRIAVGVRFVQVSSKSKRTNTRGGFNDEQSED